MIFNIDFETGMFKKIENVKIDRNLKGVSLLEFPEEFVVFDIETTGLDSTFDEIIEIGAIKVCNNRIIEEFNSLIKPNKEIDEYITELTGITNDMLCEAPQIQEVLPKFMKFIGNSFLVGHNVNFDINFVYDNLYRNGFDVLKNDFIDTMRIGRNLLPELKHHRLIDLAEHFNIDSSNNHRSLRDCEITLNIYNSEKELAKEKYGSIELFKEDLRKRHSKNYIRAKDIVASNTEFDIDNLFYDKYIAITGTLEKMVRKDAMQIVVDLGGHCEDGVTKKTNYLILGNNDYNPILRGKKSSKLVKAEKFKLEGKDIEIISENVFYDIINDYISK